MRDRGVISVYEIRATHMYTMGIYIHSQFTFKFLQTIVWNIETKTYFP